MNRKPNILICPLNWGIGHATRCVPIIKEFVKQGTNVIIGASGNSKAFLEIEFPELTCLEFPGYNVTYPADGKGMVSKMAAHIPKLIRWTKKENKILSSIINQYNIDAVISDNRFGLYSKRIPSVFITHQIFMKAPGHLRFIESQMLRYNLNYIQKFTECWIPDYSQDPNLSGDLSHKKPLPSNCYFIGPLSRFNLNEGDKNISKNDSEKFDVLILLSGPEPQRSLFEKQILTELKDSTVKAALVCGLPNSMEKKKIGNSIIYSHLNSIDLKELILNSRMIVSRSGYSTVMDLASLNKKAVFVPTPGQTEQEYLATNFKEKGLYASLLQHDFTLKKALNQKEDFSGLNLSNDGLELKSRIKKLLQSI